MDCRRRERANNDVHAGKFTSPSVSSLGALAMSQYQQSMHERGLVNSNYVTRRLHDRSVSAVKSGNLSPAGCENKHDQCTIS